MFESTPVYPNAGRYWDMIQRHKITQFYTAPTAIRLLMRFGEEIPKQYDVSQTVRVLGTVGEPINPEAWRFYYEVVGKEKCTVVDTYWQTETGGHVITNLPAITPMKPGSCTLPSYGIDPVVLDSLTGEPVTERDEHGKLSGVLAMKQPWPGMARTCLGDHGRYMKTYLTVYKGHYFTGDSVVQDKDGYYWIIGRVDDVVNVRVVSCLPREGWGTVVVCVYLGLLFEFSPFVYLCLCLARAILVGDTGFGTSHWDRRSRECLGGPFRRRPSRRGGLCP